MTPERYKSAKWEDVPLAIQKSFKELEKGKKGIYLYGAVGTGKTHICWALKKSYDDPSQFKFIRLWNVVDFIQEIKKDFDRSPAERHNLEDIVMNPRSPEKILILDDIGAERTSDFVLDVLYRIVNFRYIHKLPTIFTSNYSIEDLADRIGERTASRIVEMCEIIELTGEDRRLKN